MLEYEICAANKLSLQINLIATLQISHTNNVTNLTAKGNISNI